MRDLFVVDAFQCHPIAVPLRLACSEPRDAVPLQGVSWLHDELNNPEYLLVLVTLWHVYRYARQTLCMDPSDVWSPWYARMTSSLLQPELFQHMVMTVNATCYPSSSSSSSPSMMLSWPLSSDSDSTPTSIRSIWMPPFDVFERLASAWPSHPMHVFVLMSPGPDAEASHHEDPPRLRMCDASTIGSCTDWATRACVVVVGDGGPSRGESVCVAWLVETDSVTRDDDGGDRQAGPGGECIQQVQNFHVTSGCAGLRDASPSRTRTVRDPHEAHGVGVIVKALAQQNAGASLFLRAITYIAVLLCCIHSMFVLGKGSPLIGCQKS